MAQYSDYDVIAPLMMTEEGRDILLRNGYRIHDGDTVTTPDGKTIRLSGINTAEVANPHKGSDDQPMGRLSQNAMAYALDQGEVTADIDGKGKYGRNTGTLKSGLGDVQDYMVANHYAPVWDRYDKGHKLEKATAQNRADWAFDRPHPVKEFIDHNYGGGTRDVPHINERVRHHQGTMGRALSRGIDSLQSGLYGAAHLAGRTLEEFDTGQEIMDWAEEGIVEQERSIAAKAPDVASYRDIDDLSSFGTFALEKTIENLPILGTGGVAGLGARIAGRGASREVAKQIREEALHRSIALGRGAGVAARTAARKEGRGARDKLLNRRTAIGSGAAFGAINTGETENEQRQLENPAHPAMVALAGALKGAGDVLALGTILKKSLGVTKATGIMDAANKVTIGIGVGAMAEAPIEAAQSAVDVALRAYQDPEFELMGEQAQERVLEAFVTGGIVGGVMGGVGAGAGMVSDVVKTLPERPDADQPTPRNEGETPPNEGETPLFSPAPDARTAEIQSNLVTEILRPLVKGPGRHTAAMNLKAADPNITDEVMDRWFKSDPTDGNSIQIRDRAARQEILDYSLSRGPRNEGRDFGDAGEQGETIGAGDTPMQDGRDVNNAPSNIPTAADNFDTDGNPIERKPVVKVKAKPVVKVKAKPVVLKADADKTKTQESVAAAQASAPNANRGAGKKSNDPHNLTDDERRKIEEYHERLKKENAEVDRVQAAASEDAVSTPTDLAKVNDALSGARDQDSQAESDWHQSLLGVISKMSQGLEDQHGISKYQRMVGLINRAAPNTETVIDNKEKDDDGVPTGNVNEVPVPHSIIYHSARGKSVPYSKGTEPKHFDGAFKTMDAAINVITNVGQDVLDTVGVELLKLTRNGTWGKVTAKQADPLSSATINDGATAFIVAVPKDGEGTLKARAEEALEQNHTVTLTPQFSTTGKQSFVVKAESYEDANMGSMPNESQIKERLHIAQERADSNESAKIHAPKLIDGKDSGKLTAFSAVEISRLGAAILGTTLGEQGASTDAGYNGIKEAFLAGLNELSSAKPVTTNSGKISYGLIDPSQIGDETMVAPGILWGAIKDTTSPKWMDKTRTKDKYGKDLPEQSMTWDMSAKQSTGKKKTTTIDEVIAGRRTSTMIPRGGKGWLGEPHAGDIITFTDHGDEKTHKVWDEKTQKPKVDKNNKEITVQGTAKKARVLITKVHTITEGDLAQADFKAQWMAKTGWSESVFENVKAGSVQVEFTLDVDGYDRSKIARTDPDRSQIGSESKVQAKEGIEVSSAVVYGTDGKRLQVGPHNTKERNHAIGEKISSTFSPTSEENDNDAVDLDGEGHTPDSTPLDDDSIVRFYATYPNVGETAVDTAVDPKEEHHADKNLSGAGKAWLKLLGIASRTIISDAGGIATYQHELQRRIKDAQQVISDTKDAPVFRDEAGKPLMKENDKGEQVEVKETAQAKRERIGANKRANKLLGEINRLDKKIGALKEGGPTILYNTEYDSPELRVPVIFIPDSGNQFTNLTHLAHEFGHLVQRITVDQLITRHRDGKDEDASKIVLDLFGEVNWNDPQQALLAREIFADRFLGWVRKNQAARTVTDKFFAAFSYKMKAMWEDMRSRIHANRLKILGIKDNLYDKRAQYEDSSGKIPKNKKGKLKDVGWQEPMSEDRAKTGEATVKVKGTAALKFKKVSKNLALIKDLKKRIDILVEEERTLSIKVGLKDTSKYKPTAGLKKTLKIQEAVEKTKTALGVAKADLKSKLNVIDAAIEADREHARDTKRTSKEARAFAVERHTEAKKKYNDALKTKDAKVYGPLLEDLRRQEAALRDLDANLKVKGAPLPRSKQIKRGVTKGSTEVRKIGLKGSRYTKVISAVHEGTTTTVHGGVETSPQGLVKNNHIVSMGGEIIFARDKETGEQISVALQEKRKAALEKHTKTIDHLTETLEMQNENLRAAKVENEAVLKEHEDIKAQLKAVKEELNSALNLSVTRGIEQSDNYDAFLDALVNRANGPSTAIDGAMQTRIGKFRYNYQIKNMIKELSDMGKVQAANDLISALKEAKVFMVRNPSSKYQDVVASLSLGDTLSLDEGGVELDAFNGADIINAARGSNVGRVTMAGAARLAGSMKQWDKAYKSTDRAMRGTGSHVAWMIARDFRVRSNEAGQGTVFESTQEYKSQMYAAMADAVSHLPTPPTWLEKKLHPIEALAKENRIKDIQTALIGHLTEEEMDALGTDVKDDVRVVRAHFKRLFRKYGKRVGIEETDDYFPLVLESQGKWLQDEQRITEILGRHGYEQGEAKDVWKSISESEGQVDDSVDLFIAPGLRAKRKRGFSLALRRDLQEYYAHDLNGLVTGYTDALAKRLAWQDRYGGYEFNPDGTIVMEDEVVIDEETGAVDIVGQRPSWSPTARLDFMLNFAVNSDSDPLTRKQRDWIVKKALPAYKGTLGADMNPLLRKAQSGVLTGLIVGLLSGATLTSLPDLAGIYIRLGETDGYKRSLKGLKDTLRYLKDPAYAGEAKEYASLLVAIHSGLVDHTLSTAMEVGYMPKSAKKINDTFFRAILLKKWTDFTRIMAVQIAKDDIKHLYRTNDTKKLARLGLKPADVEVWINGGLDRNDLSNEDFQKTSPQIRMAINRWTDQAIMRPDATKRPTVGSDARGQLFFFLRDFMYTFYETVIDQTITNTRDAKGLAKAIPVIALGATVMPLAAAGYELRKLLFGKLPAEAFDIRDTTREYYGWDYLSEIARRSGIYGPLQLVDDANTDRTRGNNVLVNLMGVPFEKAVQFIDDPYKALIKTTPIIAQSSPLKNALY